MRDEKLARSEPSSPARFGQCVSSLIKTEGFGIELVSIWLSIARRGCDLMIIRISDIVCDHKIRTRATAVQHLTAKPVTNNGC